MLLVIVNNLHQNEVQELIFWVYFVVTPLLISILSFEYLYIVYAIYVKFPKKLHGSDQL